MFSGWASGSGERLEHDKIMIRCFIVNTITAPSATKTSCHLYHNHCCRYYYMLFRDAAAAIDADRLNGVH